MPVDNPADASENAPVNETTGGLATDVIRLARCRVASVYACARCNVKQVCTTYFQTMLLAL